MITMDVSELRFTVEATKVSGVVTYKILIDDYLDDHLEIEGKIILTDVEIIVYYEGYGITLRADLTVTETLFSAKQVEVVLYDEQILLDELSDVIEEDE